MTRARTETAAAKPRRGLLARFARDTRGGFATMLAVTAIPMIAMAGIGVDVARVLSARTDLQAATDNAALALARQPASAQQINASASGACPGMAAGNGGVAPTVFQAQACNWVLANFSRSDASHLVVTPTSTSAQVAVAGAVDVTTTLSGIMGYKTMHITVNSVVKRNISHIELVLVLDNTFSMNDDNKIGTLKSAASSLVDTLTQSAVSSGDPNALKIGVVPFAATVNVGTQNSNANWLAWTAPYGVTGDIFLGNSRATFLQAAGQTWGGCVEDRPMPYDVLDTAPNASIGATMFTPYVAPDEPDDNVPSHGYLWPNSYLNDQLGPFNTDPTAAYTTFNKYNAPVQPYASGNFWTSYFDNLLGQHNHGANYGCGTQPLMRLTPVRSTSDTTAIHAELNGMTPYGTTIIPMGLIWGWHVLSPNAPFSDGAAYGTPNTIKIVVLVTDGSNTYLQASSGLDTYFNSMYTSLGYAAGGPNHDTANAFKARVAVNGPVRVGDTATGDYSQPVVNAVDDRLSKLCANMKAAPSNIIVYTVPVEVTDTNIKSRLQNCASDTNHYIDATSTSALTAAFSSIAGQISALRVAQ